MDKPLLASSNRYDNDNENISDWSEGDDIELDTSEKTNYRKTHKRRTFFGIEMSQLKSASRNTFSDIQHSSNNNFSNPLYDNQNHNDNNFEPPKGHVKSDNLSSNQNNQSTNHQVYNIENQSQFNGPPPESSRSSVIISLFIVLVIVFVTIVPLFMPQTAKDPNSLNTTIPLYEHKDVRCKCVCPPLPQNSTSTSKDKSDSKKSVDERRLYVKDTTPDQCNCENLVLSELPIDSKMGDFCVRCECKYQSRNTTTIRRVVLFFISVLSGFCAYILFQFTMRYLKANGYWR